MKMVPRSLGNKHQWAIILNVDMYDRILISLVDGAALMDGNNKSIALFKKNAIVTKHGEEYTYNDSDLMSSTKSTQQC